GADHRCGPRGLDRAWRAGRPRPAGARAPPAAAGRCWRRTAWACAATGRSNTSGHSPAEL
ncbi:MAG: hypothetical protein AVDCRST_MAG68-512, partial [uncultured Gemmatimonadetes bacterium]